MNLISSFDWSAKSIAKALGLVALGAVVLGVVISMLMLPFRLIAQPFTGGYGGGYPEYAESAAYDDYAIRATNKLGIIPPIEPEEGIDGDAEAYEVEDYSANFRPNDKTEICATVSDLKADEEIVFESANESDRSCSYRFRVPRERADEVVALLEELDPEDLSVSVYTIQRTIQDNESRVDILKAKLAEKEAALTEAQVSYDELTEMATRARDVENLTKLIDLKINTIDRLADERLNLTRELDQMAAEQQRQLTRIATTGFSVSVYEDRIVDWGDLGDEWERAVQQFVADVNGLLQAVSIGLLTWLLRAGLAVVYLLVLVGLARLVWSAGKRVWMWRK